MHLVCPATRSAAARMAQLSIMDALFGRCADNPAAAETNLRCTIFCRQNTTGTLVGLPGDA
jgi:hypothetical protein